MRITSESDYALRIVTALARHSEVVDAKTLSEETSVTLRFTLKILHKLVTEGIVASYKGVKGGYLLRQEPQAITLLQIIELIDGPIAIVRCLESAEGCTLNNDKTACIYHYIFNSISADVAKRLSGITIADAMNKKI